MHIAIEGMDGVGKTATARMLAQRLGYIFVEKPLHLLLDSESNYDNYLQISDFVNEQENENLKAMFYGISNLYLCEQFKNKNIITDRYLVSNYFWNSSILNESFFKYLTDVCKKPDITILLYSDVKTRFQRIFNRNSNDSDLIEVDKYPNAYEKMQNFLKKYNMNFFCIDNSKMNLQKTVDEIYNIVLHI